MLERAFAFLASVAFNGFFAIFIAGFLYIILAVLFSLAVIPVSIIGSHGLADKIMDAGKDIGYKFVYTIVFIYMIMDDFGVTNIKAAFKRWRQKSG